MQTTGVLDTGVAVDPALHAVHIVGFAPSWVETPWDDPTAQRWGMNALHRVAGDKPWTAWFQLHDIDRHHTTDKAEHMSWLIQSGIPVYMWEEHISRYPIPNAVPYPRAEIVDRFGPYFTNTVSWMVALAIHQGFRNVGVFGVDMAQDTEYASQRPSCEFFLGWALGKGVNIHIPRTSDLLKAPYLYGLEDELANPWREKIDARLTDLRTRAAEAQSVRDSAHSTYLQLLGALEDSEYYRRAWTMPMASDGKV